MRTPKNLNDDGAKLYRKLWREDLESSILHAYCLAYQNFIKAQEAMQGMPLEEIPQRIITLWKGSASVMNQLGNKLKLDKPADDPIPDDDINDLFNEGQ